MTGMSIRGAIAAMIVLMLVPAGTPAQAAPDPEPVVIHACYVPSTGTIYRTGEPGLPQECTGPKQGANRHVRFSWNEQGQEGPQGEPGPQGEQGPPGEPGSPIGTLNHGDLQDLEADDHPQYLVHTGDRTSEGFAVIGALGTGTLAATGAGVRLLWHPAKAAIRAGQVTDGRWDETGIGLHSVAMGRNTYARGQASTAMGEETTATGEKSTALGYLGTASGAVSTALGFWTKASGTASTAMGSNSEATGTGSTAMGNFARATGDAATAMGYRTIAGGFGAVAMGADASTAGHDGVFIFGDRSTEGSLGGGVVEATADNQFTVRAAGGFRLRTAPDLSTGCDITAGNLSCTGTLTQSSDIRLKVDVAPVDDVLGRVLALTPIRYRFQRGTGHPDEPKLGLSAQDVRAAFPELVSTGPDGYLTVAYGELSAVLVRAVQELEMQNRAQDQRIVDLEGRLARLEALLVDSR